jgi:hypothetical protein
MADLVTIGQLSALVEDQFRLLGYLEDNRDQVPAFDPIFPDKNQIEIKVAGEPWSITVTRTGWECCHREAGRTVLLDPEHPSPFDFHPDGLLRFVLSLDQDSRLNDIVIDNWILKFVLAGRLTKSRHRPGYYTFG